MRVLIALLFLCSTLSAQTGWVGKKMSAYPALTTIPDSLDYALFNHVGVTHRVNVKQLRLSILDTTCGKPWCTGGNAPTNSTSFLGTTNSKDLVFKTKNTEAMRIDTNGNVGIGTATPIKKLDLYGAAKIEVDGAFSGSDATIDTTGIFLATNQANNKSAYITLDGTVTISTQSAVSDKEASLTTDTSQIYISLADGALAKSQIGLTTNNIDFSTNDTIRASIDYAGNFVIGTGTPTAKLHVNGDVRIEGTDSVTIYAKTPSNGTFEYCTNCTGNGITGRLLGYIGSAWRRFTIE